MTPLQISQMEEMASGEEIGLEKLVDGVCVTWGTSYMFSIIAHNPFTGTFAACMDVGCGLWALYRFIS